MSYCGLVDVRINASDKDLPVTDKQFIFQTALTFYGDKKKLQNYLNANVRPTKKLMTFCVQISKKI